jgi:hypothetical protein
MARWWPLLSADGRFLKIEMAMLSTELWDLERGEIPAAWPAGVRGVAFRAVRVHTLGPLKTRGISITDDCKTPVLRLSDAPRPLILQRPDL